MEINIGDKFGLLTVVGLNQLKSSTGLGQYYDTACQCGKPKIVRKSDLIANRIKSCGCTRRHDLIGRVFGSLTVISRNNEASDKNKKSSFNCLCECGGSVVVKASKLKEGTVKSCGCGIRQHNPPIDLSGQVFNRLTVLSINEELSKKHKQTYSDCICECGNLVIVKNIALKSNNTMSCGCLRQEIHTKHGMHNTPTYSTWEGMKQRCLNPNNLNYHHYGGRGITICDRWLDPDKGFLNFLGDMGERPEGLSIDRIDVNGNYEPDNCRWATWVQQCNNKRNSLNRL